LDELFRLSPTGYHALIRQTVEQLVGLGFVVSNTFPANKGKDARLSYRIEVVGQPHLAAAAEKAIASIGLDVEAIGLADDWPDAPTTDALEKILAFVWGREGAAATNDKEIFLVVAVSGNEPEICRQIGRICAANGTPWALFRYTGALFEVGPLIVPGETACFDCVTLRTLAAAQDYTAEYEFLQYLSDPNRPRVNLNPPQGLTELAASVLTNELESFCSEGGDSGICNGVWLIGSRPLRLKLHRLLKIPGCPTCEVGIKRHVGSASN
jgi:ribosomal protein S12 methylthiotransferase accessory factor